MPSPPHTREDLAPGRSAGRPWSVQRGRGAERALIGFFLTLLVSPFLLQTIVEIHRGEGFSALLVVGQPPTSASLRAYERQLQDASVVARFVRPWMQFVQFA